MSLADFVSWFCEFDRFYEFGGFIEFDGICEFDEFYELGGSSEYDGFCEFDGFSGFYEFDGFIEIIENIRKKC